LHLHLPQPDDLLIVTPSDHIIGNADLYEQSIQEAIDKASNGYIVFGIVPTKPETGYGYIERSGDNDFLS
jgi:mannose-1-phosphate guanylyltransferase